MSVNPTEFFAVKTACLFHDPPDKSWRRIGHVKRACGALSLLVNDTALAQASHLFPEDESIIDKRVRLADRFASSVDRWLLSLLIKAHWDALKVEGVKLKNVFNPSFQLELTRFEEKVEKAYEEYKINLAQLNGLLRERQNEPFLSYHLVYALHESFWISAGGFCGPADTRIPTSSVFDHVYASATLSNWLIGSKSERLEGYMLVLDLGGAQKYIAASRKLRDLWASSYLISALAWATVWPLVKALGPDILLLPTCRHNPFYYHRLLAWLREARVADKELKWFKHLIKPLFPEGSYEPETEPFPRFAIIPGTLTLALPRYDVLSSMLRACPPPVGGLRSFEEIRAEARDEPARVNELCKREIRQLLTELFRWNWRQISASLLDPDNYQDDQGALQHVLRSLKQLKQYFDVIVSVPPLPLRVAILSMEERLEPKELVEGSEERGDITYYQYHSLARTLQHVHVKEKLVKESQFARLDLTSLTAQLEEGGLGWPKGSRRGFDYCTVCGELPAALLMPPEPQAESEERKYAEYARQLEFPADAEGVKQLIPLLSPGEKLCPYCLVKRLSTVQLNRIVEVLLGKPEGQPRVGFPSTSDFAAIRWKEDVIKQVTSQPTEFKDSFLEAFGKTCKDTRLKDLGLYENPVWKWQREWVNELEKKPMGAELKRTLQAFILHDAESLYFGEAERKVWRDFSRKVEVNPPKTYYALVKGDCDNIGKLLSGEIGEATGLSARDYVISAFEGEAKRLVDFCIQGQTERAVKLLTEERLTQQEAEERINQFKKLLNYMIDGRHLVLGPAYHVALGRALILNGLNDAVLVEKLNGVVVYAGGDDLLALMPTDRALNALYETRRAFGLGRPADLWPGFTKLNEYAAPSLAPAGRSYCLYLAHYLYPLYAVIEDSHRKLEGESKKSAWEAAQAQRVRKDTATVVYSPRGGAVVGRIPLRLTSPIMPESGKALAQPIFFLNKLLEQVEGGKLSHSFIYAATEDCSARRSMYERDVQIARRLLEMLVDRHKDSRTVPKLAQEMAEVLGLLAENSSLNVRLNGAGEPFGFLGEFFTAARCIFGGLRETG